MSKRTPEEIIQSVERYQQRETSQGAEAKRLGVSQQSFQDGIRKYEIHGKSGFLRTEKRRCSKELKLSAVQAYLNGEGSQAAICKRCCGQRRCYCLRLQEVRQLAEKTLTHNRS